MNYIASLIGVIGICVIACKSTPSKNIVPIDSTSLQKDSMILYCDTTIRKIKYIEGVVEVIDTSAKIITCGQINIKRPSQFASVSGVVIKLSSGKEIDPNNITWVSKH